MQTAKEWTMLQYWCLCTAHDSHNRAFVLWADIAEHEAKEKLIWNQLLHLLEAASYQNICQIW